MKRQALLDIAAKGTRNPDYTMRPVAMGAPSPFPFYDRDTKKAHLAYACINEMVHKTNEKKHHNVVIAYVPAMKDNGYFFWCGDTYLEGKVDRDEALARVNEAASGKSALQKDMLTLHASLKTSSGCRFWQGKEKICSHTEHALAGVRLENVLSELEAAANVKNKGAAPNQTGITEMLAKCAFRKHFMIEGDKGSGKTHTVYAFADSMKIPHSNRVLLAGHEGVEAIDMVGHYVNSHEGMVWKDGKLARAFRVAARGQRTLLFVDEIGRIPRRELNILVGALTPDNVGQYHLSTGRVVRVEDGVAVEETITCKAEHLWVVSTTNVGSGYDVEGFDEALLDRFRIGRQDTTEPLIRAVLGELCNRKGFKQTVVDRAVAFWKHMGEFRSQGTLTRIVDLRHLVEAVDMADKETEIKQNLADSMLSWVERDTEGQPVSEQVDAVLAILAKAWK